MPSRFVLDLTTAPRVRTQGSALKSITILSLAFGAPEAIAATKLAHSCTALSRPILSAWPELSASRKSSIFLRRIVGPMFMRVNSKCAHQVRPPPGRIRGVQ